MRNPTYAEATTFVRWLLARVVADARGDNVEELRIRPDGRFWLGRLAPEEKTLNSNFGERGERLEPCQIGIQLRPSALDGRTIECTARLVAWKEESKASKDEQARWVKLAPIERTIRIALPTRPGEVATAGRAELGDALAASGAAGLIAEVEAEVEIGPHGPEVAISLINRSPEERAGLDTNLYEASLEVAPGATQPFILDALEDSFRYRREVDAYGNFCGAERRGDRFVTTDTIQSERPRPVYWDEAHMGAEPDLSFHRLSEDPIPQLQRLADAATRWGGRFWAAGQLDERQAQEGWSPPMRAAAGTEAAKYGVEVDRLRRGIRALEEDAVLLRAFRLANRAFETTMAGKYDRWRPFQIGFLLATLPSIHAESQDAEAEFVDALWFATGGGKTETYLGLLLTGAFHDRLSGKMCGIGAWVRFPLRMLSLQQTQRFADIFAAAEQVRRAEAIPGTPFSVGFLVGPATPNKIKKRPEAGEPRWDDPEMPAQYQVLLNCPFCRSDRIRMAFDVERWTLDHWCDAKDCTWHDGPLPFRIVDDELYRFLPTVVVGTLDKAANLGMQQAMRAFYGAPLGLCPTSGHGFTYVPRSSSPSGCLFPDCAAKPKPLPQAPDLFPPRIRIQDELHLLRDALGAVDSHYEALLDQLLAAHGVRAKVLASSATLQGFPEQVRTLYQREGRAFPLPGPRSDTSFWSQPSDRLMRVFAGVAPRGVTQEFASDRTNEALQRAIRRANQFPEECAAEIGVDSEVIPSLVSFYGVGVVYGSTIRDVEAAARSFETQIPLEPLTSVTLTGNTPFDEVRQALGQLTHDGDLPFDQRLHLVAASSMLSHGVDIERLNVMLMLGLPLSAAEFIQTTSRVGRSWPGLVIVLHKVSRARDAAVFRMFRPFVEHADRLIEAIPVTRKSRKVLEVTYPGLFQGRVLGVHEEKAVAAKMRPLTTIRSIRAAYQRLPVLEEAELAALIDMIGIGDALDEKLREDLMTMVRATFHAIGEPSTSGRFLSDVLPRRPMRSLRDVEDQVDVYERRRGTS